MASSPACQCFLTLVLLVVAASPPQTHARESRFFSKVSRAETPNTETPKPETPKAESVSPTSSPSEAKTEHGYGLLGKEETYEYSPTTENPTKSETRGLKYVEPNGVKGANKGGYRYEAGEKQGMSDTRFLEGGRYFHDISSEKEAATSNGKLMEEDDGHESYYGHGYESNGDRFKEERYETEDKHGMRGGTRVMNNGRYFYHLGEEERRPSNERYGSNVESYKTNKYANEEEEEEEEEYGKRGYRVGERQGMSDTRFMAKGRYFYDIKNEDPSVVEAYEKAKRSDEYYEKAGYKGEESYDGNYEKENGEASGYDFRSTPNNFPRYEFDSMEEYEKYEQGRSHQTEYEH